LGQKKKTAKKGHQWRNIEKDEKRHGRENEKKDTTNGKKN